MGTLAAFWLFQQAALDAVVLEVGLGGRLDTVNVVDADMALVTSIGVDHADYLGDTRESVAFEKAGIFRQGASCAVWRPESSATVCWTSARELELPVLSLRGRDFDLGIVPISAGKWRGTDAQGSVCVELRDLPLLDLPMENAALALQAYLLLGLPWDAISRFVAALQATRVVGRLDRRSRSSGRASACNLLLDVGHNPHAAEFLARRLASQRPPVGKRLAVFGLLATRIWMALSAN
jgi:dihydrofolate synthase/folylpolyglutamate synthase